MTGWIKIQRSFIDWEWFDQPGMVQLFLYLLIKANHSPKEWHGAIIERGQIVTSVAKISAETRLSTQVVRTCINRLKSTNEITSKSTNKYTIITINKYDTYQGCDEIDNKQINEQPNKQPNKQATSKQQASNKQLTTNKNKENNKNNKNNSTHTHTSELLKFLSCAPANTREQVQRMVEVAQEIRQRVYSNATDKEIHDNLTNVDKGFIFFWATFPRLMKLFDESMNYQTFCYINDRYEVSDIQRVIEAMANKMPQTEERRSSFLTTFKQWAISDYQIAEKKRLGNPKYA